MITEWTLKNFKSIKKLEQLKIAPVTILAGANSSGKTTLLQSILLLAQTLSSPIGSRIVVLNGDQVKLGTWLDVPHAEFLGEPVEIGCRLELPKDYRPIDPGRSISTGRPPIRSRRLLRNISRIGLSVSLKTPDIRTGLSFEPFIHEARFTVEVPVSQDTRAKTISREIDLVVRRRKRLRSKKQLSELVPLLPAGVNESALNYLIEETSPQLEFDFGDEFGYESQRILHTSTLGANFVHFLPNRIVRKYDATARQIEEQIRYLLSAWTSKSQKRSSARALVNLTQKASDKQPQEVIRQMAKCINGFLELFNVNERIDGSSTNEIIGFLASLYTRLRLQRRLPEIALFLSVDWQEMIPQKYRQFSVETTSISEPLQTGIRILRDFFTSRVKYLGPLRDEPRVIYSLPPTPDVSDVGIRGEYTAAVLDRNKLRMVTFEDPRSKRRRNMPLQEAVCFWLNYMGILDTVSTVDAGKLGYRLNVRAPKLDRDLDLTTVGVGASQVLPILVMALMAQANTLLVFEQPEIHLHPRVQSILGDFFLSMGQVGKFCLVETHSEYLVNQLRNRIVKAKGDEILKIVKMYFVIREGNASVFQQVQLDEYGAIANWPSGFFDESTLQTESIIRVRAGKRRLKKEQGDEGTA